MNSNNWPLWEVFIRSKLSHIHVGSLHATDADMALENARDVYTRRMEGVSIWVIPSIEIDAFDMSGGIENPTSEVIHAHPTFEEEQPISKASNNEDWVQWEVFFRTKKGLSHKHVGSIQSATAQGTLEKALAIYQDTLKVTNIWAVQSNHITASNPTDKEAFYDPAEDKHFRHATYYDIPDEVKHM